MTRRDLIVGAGGVLCGMLLADMLTPDYPASARPARRPTKTPKGRVPSPTPTATPTPDWTAPGRDIGGYGYVEHFGAYFDPTRSVSLWTSLKAHASGGPFFAGVCLIGPDRNWYGQVGYGFRHDLPNDDQDVVGFLMVNEWGAVQPSNVLAWKLDRPGEWHRVGIEYRPSSREWIAWIDGVPKRSMVSPPPSPWVQPAIYTGTVHHNEPGYEQRELVASVGPIAVYGTRI